MADCYIGEIRILPYTFPPADWAWCDGSSVSSFQYQALFSVIGFTYGGDGKTNFNLPNLQGTVAMDQGTGVGLTTRTLAQHVGTPTVVLEGYNTPPHNHTLSIPIPAAASAGQTGAPAANTMLAGENTTLKLFNPTTVSTATTTLSPMAFAYTGGGQAHSNNQPFLVLNFCICVINGIYPVKP